MHKRACVLSFSLESSVIITISVVLTGPAGSGISLHQNLYTAKQEQVAFLEARHLNKYNGRNRSVGPLQSNACLRVIFTVFWVSLFVLFGTLNDFIPVLLTRWLPEESAHIFCV